MQMMTMSTPVGTSPPRVLRNCGGGSNRNPNSKSDLEGTKLPSIRIDGDAGLPRVFFENFVQKRRPCVIKQSVHMSTQLSTLSM